VEWKEGKLNHNKDEFPKNYFIWYNIMMNYKIYLLHTLKFGIRGLHILILSIKLLGILKENNVLVQSVHSVTECMICNHICRVYGNTANKALCDTVHRLYQNHYLLSKCPTVLWTTTLYADLIFQISNELNGKCKECRQNFISAPEKGIFLTVPVFMQLLTL